MPNQNKNNKTPRPGCKDLWNSFMVSHAEFSTIADMPICYSTATTAPNDLISFDEAKTIVNRENKKGNKNFKQDSWIHFYIDDYKFDGKRNSIWTYPFEALKILVHFAGIITPDFSTYADFPDPLKRFNTYRMRAFGCWMNILGIPVINNVRWGTIETWPYSFDGIPKHSIVSIGTVASDLKTKQGRILFEQGLSEMVKIIKPRAILVYGSSNYPFFDKLRESDIKIITFQSKKNQIFSKRCTIE